MWQLFDVVDAFSLELPSRRSAYIGKRSGGPSRPLDERVHRHTGGSNRIDHLLANFVSGTADGRSDDRLNGRRCIQLAKRADRHPQNIGRHASPAGMDRCHRDRWRAQHQKHRYTVGRSDCQDHPRGGGEDAVPLPGDAAILNSMDGRAMHLMNPRNRGPRHRKSRGSGRPSLRSGVSAKIQPITRAIKPGGKTVPHIDPTCEAGRSQERQWKRSLLSHERTRGEVGFGP